jgi:hypothetical protein
MAGSFAAVRSDDCLRKLQPARPIYQKQRTRAPSSGKHAPAAQPARRSSPLRSVPRTVDVEKDVDAPLGAKRSGSIRHAVRGP